jgi:hypothetical protein
VFAVFTNELAPPPGTPAAADVGVSAQSDSEPLDLSSSFGPAQAG